MGRFTSSGRSTTSGRSGYFSARSRSPGRGQARSVRSGRGDNNRRKSQQTDLKFGTQTGKGFATFASVKEYFCNYVQKTYEYGGDVGQAIMDQKEVAFKKIEPQLSPPRVLNAEEQGLSPAEQAELLKTDEQSRTMK